VQPKLWVWESRSQRFLLDSWLQPTGAQGKPKDQHARATKGHSGKEGIWKDEINLLEIARLSRIGFEEDLPGRGGRQENLLQEQMGRTLD